MTRRSPLIVTTALPLAIGAATMARGAGGLDLSWNTIDGGGGTAASGAFMLCGTIAQHDAGTMSGGGFALRGGFWAVEGGGDGLLCPGDTNADGVVDVQDLVDVVLSWGPCSAGPDSCPADTNDDGAVDVQDLVSVVLAWGPCP
jgi:hypothetical protein